MLSISSAKENSLFVSSRVFLSWFSLRLVPLVLDLRKLSLITDAVCLFRSDRFDLIFLRSLFMSLVAALCLFFCFSFSFLDLDRCCAGDGACPLLGDVIGLIFVSCFFIAFVAGAKFCFSFSLFFWGLDG